jgi:CubicO group peptidase (beta-lactamase class C family)
MIRSCIAAQLLAVAAASVAFTSSAVADSLSAEGAATIKRQLEQAVARGDTPGVVASVVDRNGTLFETAVGSSSAATKAPMSPDSIFYMASMTKPVTSVAIMMLIEQQKVALEDPVSKFLPGFDKLQVLTRFNEADGTYETRPATVVMTVRHLLTHTSGIGYAFSNPTLERLMRGTTKSEWEMPLLHEPGEKWTYGASTRLLGYIVEKVAGTTLEDFFQDQLFKPLGMVDTSFAVVESKQARLAAPHARIEGLIQVQRDSPPAPSKPPVPVRGDGGLYSTAKDYGIFVRTLLNGGKLDNVRILSEKSVAQMGENHIGNIFVEQQPVGLPARTKVFPLGAGRDKFGLGFQIAAAGPETEVYRRAGSLSWAGIMNTEFWIDPQRQIGGILLMQVLPFYDDGAIRTLQEFEAAVYRGIQ